MNFNPQKTIDFRDYARTPQAFMRKLNKAKVTPVRDPKRPGVVAIVHLKPLKKRRK